MDAASHELCINLRADLIPAQKAYSELATALLSGEDFASHLEWLAETRTNTVALRRNLQRDAGKLMQLGESGPQPPSGEAVRARLKVKLQLAVPLGILPRMLLRLVTELDALIAGCSQVVAPEHYRTVVLLPRQNVVQQCNEIASTIYRSVRDMNELLKPSATA